METMCNILLVTHHLHICIFAHPHIYLSHHLHTCTSEICTFDFSKVRAVAAFFKYAA